MIKNVFCDFSQALLLLKANKRMTRSAWEDKCEFVFLVPASTFAVNRPPLLGIYPIGTEINYHGHIDQRTETGQIMPWSPSQQDLLAVDWHEVTVDWFDPIQ